MFNKQRNFSSHRGNGVSIRRPFKKSFNRSSNHSDSNSVGKSSNGNSQSFGNGGFKPRSFSGNGGFRNRSENNFFQNNRNSFNGQRNNFGRRKRHESKLVGADVNIFVKKAEVKSEEVIYTPHNSFEDFNLSKILKQNIVQANKTRQNQF